MLTIEELEARRAVLIKERERAQIAAARTDHGYAVVIGEIERWIGQLIAAQAEPQTTETPPEE